MKKRLVLFAVLVSLTSCSKFEPTTSTVSDRRPTAEEQLKKDEFLRDKQRFSAAPARPFDVSEYALKGQFDWSRSRLTATVVVTLTRDPGLRHIELDSYVAKVSKVAMVTGEDLPFTVNTKDHLLSFDLPQSLADATVSVKIDYEVVGGGQADERRKNLNVITPRMGDPVQSRVLYTRSEPMGAHAWMPCNDRPSDGARFSVELTMPSSELMIANGRLQKDVVTGAERTMAYRTDHPIPTYLMAFAQGDFVQATRLHGALPVSVWARRGVQVDWDSILDETVREIALYEKLLTPYPYEKYAIVLVPEFGGGMEHASITFNEELRSSQPLRSDFGLMAHELGHHWFGDYMTVNGWDDLWVKEGMATLLSGEAMRTFEDERDTGLMMGDVFGVKNGDAIRDPGLAPEAKYTSGPYGRSAWFYTQLRSIVGEKAFWGTLRGLLLSHEYGSVTSEEVVGAFRSLLGEARYAKALASLNAHEFPEMKIEVNGDVVNVSVEDKEETLLAPLEIVSISTVGSQARQSLASGGSVSLERRPGTFISFDPRDVHPSFSTWIRGTDAEVNRRKMDVALAKFATPSNSDEISMFATLPLSTQVAALMMPNGWSTLSASEFTKIHDGLSSATARFMSMALACTRAREATDPADQTAWNEILSDVMLNPDLLGMHSASGSLLFSNCRGVVPSVVTNRLEMIEKQASASRIGDAELSYLGYMPVENVVSTWSSIAETGRSLRARLIALDVIANRAGLGGQKGPSVNDAKAMFRRLLDSSDIQSVVTTAMYGAVNLRDADALKPLAGVTKRRTVQTWVSRSAACSAWAIASGDQGLWDGYLTEVGSLTDLPAYVREAVESPRTACQ